MQSNKNFLHYVAHDYVLLLLLFVVVCGFYVAQKNYLKLLAVLLFFFGYLLLINVSYAQGSPQFYIENQYLLLSVFVGIPFVFDVLPFAKLSTQRVIISTLALTCVFRVYNTHLFYTNRVNWYRNVLAKTEKLPNKKIIYQPSSLPMDTVIMTWASSYEFWLLSTLESKESRSIIFEGRPSEFDWVMNNNKHFISQWGAFPYDSLPRNYFHFNDTTYYTYGTN